MNQVTYRVYNDVYEPDDEHIIYQPNYENQDAAYQDDEYEEQYTIVHKENKPSLWERIKGFFAKLGQRDGVGWKLLDIFIDTALISLTGPFYMIAKVAVNGIVQWIRTKVEGKLAEYLSQYVY